MEVSDVGASEACFHMPYAGIFPHTCLHGPVSIIMKMRGPRPHVMACLARGVPRVLVLLLFLLAYLDEANHMCAAHHVKSCSMLRRCVDQAPKTLRPLDAAEIFSGVGDAAAATMHVC